MPVIEMQGAVAAQGTLAGVLARKVALLGVSAGLATPVGGLAGRIAISGNSTGRATLGSAPTLRMLEDAGGILGEVFYVDGYGVETPVDVGLLLNGYALVWNETLDKLQYVLVSSGSAAPSNAQYLVLALDGTLTAERRLVAGSNITITDGGANGNATIAATIPSVLHAMIDMPTRQGSNISGSANAFKGVTIKADGTVTVDRILALLDVISGGVYKAVLLELNNSDVIQSVVASATFTAPASVTDSLLKFSITPTTLVSGTRYAIMVGRTDAGNTYVLPIHVSAEAMKWAIPGVTSDAGSTILCVLPQAAPAAGQTVTVAGQSTYTMGVGVTF